MEVGRKNKWGQLSVLQVPMRAAEATVDPALEANFSPAHPAALSPLLQTPIPGLSLANFLPVNLFPEANLQQHSCCSVAGRLCLAPAVERVTEWLWPRPCKKSREPLRGQAFGCQCEARGSSSLCIMVTGNVQEHSVSLGDSEDQS